MNDQLSQTFFTDLGLADMSEQDKTAFKVGFMQELNSRVSVLLADKMNDDQAKKLNELITAGDAQKLYEYQKSQFPDIDSMMGQAFAALKQEVIDGKDDLEDDTLEESPQFATIASKPIFDMASVAAPASPPPITDK